MYRFPRVIDEMLPQLLRTAQEMLNGTYVEPTTVWVDDDRPDYPDYADATVEFGGGD